MICCDKNSVINSNQSSNQLFNQYNKINQTLSKYVSLSLYKKIKKDCYDQGMLFSLTSQTISEPCIIEIIRIKFINLTYTLTVPPNKEDCIFEWVICKQGMIQNKLLDFNKHCFYQQTVWGYPYMEDPHIPDLLKQLIEDLKQKNPVMSTPNLHPRQIVLD